MSWRTVLFIQSTVWFVIAVFPERPSHINTWRGLSVLLIVNKAICQFCTVRVVGKIYFPLLNTLLLFFYWKITDLSMVEHKAAGGGWGGRSSSLRLIWAAHQEPVGRIKERKGIGKGRRRKEGLWHFISLLVFFRWIVVVVVFWACYVCVAGMLSFVWVWTRGWCWVLSHHSPLYILRLSLPLTPELPSSPGLAV